MAKFINETLGMLNPADTLTTGFQNVARPNDPLEGLFTDQTTPNLVATYHTMASEYSIPQMAQFHAFDVEAEKSIPAPIDEHNVEKGLIKVKRNTTELLRQLTGRGVTIESELYNAVMDFAGDLSNQVVTRAKVARAELLATGKVTINENNVNLVVDYGVPADNLSLELDLGAGAAKDVATQLQELVDNAADKGITLTGMVCARSTLTKMRQNKSIQKAINGVNMEGVLVTNAQLRAWLDDEFGIATVITDDLSYSLPYTLDANGRPQVHQERYFPKSKVTFYGTGNGMRLGAGLWGVPPEVDLANYYEGGVTNRDTYVYISQWTEKDPAVLWTKASSLYMPVLFNPNSLYVATVTETAGA